MSASKVWEFRWPLEGNGRNNFRIDIGRRTLLVVRENVGKEAKKYPGITVGFIRSRDGFILATCDLPRFLVGEYENVEIKNFEGLPTLSELIHKYGRTCRIREGENIDVYVLPGIYRFILGFKKESLKELFELQKDIKIFYPLTLTLKEANDEEIKENIMTYLVKDKLFLYDSMSVKTKIFRLFLSGRTLDFEWEDGNYSVFIFNNTDCLKAFLGKRSASDYKTILGKSNYVEFLFKEDENKIERKTFKNIDDITINGIKLQIIEQILNSNHIKTLLGFLLKKKKRGREKKCVVGIAKNIYELVSQSTNNPKFEIVENKNMRIIYALVKK